MEYKDIRYKFEFESGKPKVEEQHGIDQEAGKFSANLNRLPVLKLEDGRAIGRDVQPALIGRHYVTERDSAPVQNNGIV